MADVPWYEHEELVRSLTDGFQSLLEEFQLLALQNARLEQRLADAQKQFASFAQHLPTPSSEYPMSDHDDLVRTLATGASIRSENQLPLSPARALETIQSLKDTNPNSYAAIQDGIKYLQDFKARQILREESGVEHSALVTPTNERTRDTSTASRREREECNSMGEEDFTTPAVAGNLRCPFVSIAKTRGKRRLGSQASDSQRPGRLPTPPETKTSIIIDPIAAEFHADIVPSPPPSVIASASKCPIRFLNQHSPEEVAQYFENHKHEIPRSHEVCVRRYQTNSESIRQLDAKYGNLVNMIQGLGIKHQSLLPTKEEEEAAAMERSKSMEAVEQWAEGIGGNGMAEAVEGVEAEDKDQQREGHFERSLKEIRVGESPSRPWGISVPFADGLALSNDYEKNRADADLPPPVLALSDVDAKKAISEGECSFDHGADTDTAPAIGHPTDDNVSSQSWLGRSVPASAMKSRHIPSHRGTERSKTSLSKQPQMVFMGPVFINYPAEQAATLMEQFSAGGRAPKAQ
ncbi:hypothetical protein LPUS_10186 [Lasallia pustulata]|uniref:Uncharacterized protein n=1 Tax=Lasallia pustulata TaxID=136370 RepID=A0A1W5D978_9LECA|nr:hypothetical protein LPUS_10186 [Lasallia pustulata]